MSRFSSTRGVSSTGIKPTFGEDLNWVKDITVLDPTSKVNDGKQQHYRFVGPMYILGRHWYKTINGKNFPFWCTKFDGSTQEPLEHLACCGCDFSNRPELVMVGNAIDRVLQKAGNKNPVGVYILPHRSIYSLINGIIEMNDGIGVEDEVNGKDLGITYKSREQAKNKWTVASGDRRPLTQEELNYEYYNLDDIIPDFSMDSVHEQWYKQNKRSLVNNMYYIRQIQADIFPDNPWGSFEKDYNNGTMWTSFPELVLFEQSKSDAQGKPDPRLWKTGTPKPSFNNNKRDFVNNETGQVSTERQTPARNLEAMQGYDKDDEDFDVAPVVAVKEAPKTSDVKATADNVVKKKKPLPSCFGKEYGNRPECTTTCPKIVVQRCAEKSSSL